MLLLGVLAGGASALLLKQHQELAVTKAELADVKTTATAQRSELEQMQERARDLETELGAARAKITAGENAPILVGDGDTPVTFREAIVSTGLVRRWVNEANSPEFLRRTYVELQANVQRRYGPLFKRLGLSSAEAEQFVRLLVDKRQVGVDIAVSTVAHSEDPLKNASWYQSAAEVQKAAAEEQIKKFLGDDRYTAYRTYDRGLAQTDTVGLLKEKLSQSEQPLTEEQSTRFRQLLERNDVGHVNEKIIADAESFLSESQREALKTVWEQQQAAAQRRAELGLPVLPVIGTASPAEDP
jgi:hypothetical protein